MPQGLCKRFYNIFHWSDPVAYRMEPLLERGYSKIEPVLIPPYGGVDGQQTEQSPPTMSNADQNCSLIGISDSFYLFSNYSIYFQFKIFNSR